MISKFVVGLISIIVVLFCITMLVKEEYLRKIYDSLEDIPKYVKIILISTVIVLLVFLVVFEIMQYFK